MAEIPDEAVRLAGLAIRELDAGTPEDFARAALGAAAPVLAEHIAQEILAHAEHRHPRDKDHVPTAWDRHFSIAARVAAGAFYTDEDKMRLAAEAIGRGEFIGCDPPEVPRRAPAVSDRNARVVACPSCGAPAGEMCRTMTQRTPGVPGYKMSTSHAARGRAAVAASNPPEVPR